MGYEGDHLSLVQFDKLKDFLSTFPRISRYHTALEPGMVITTEPMPTIADGRPGAGGYRVHDIMIITEDGNEDITKYPYGPEFNVVGYHICLPSPDRRPGR